MSWLNPTPDEAAESYSYYKNKYYNAANQKRTSEKQEQAYVSQKKSATSKMNALSSQKVILEKRLSGIANIIKMLEGTGGWFSANVPSAISKATSALNKTSDSYRSCIKMSGVVAASLESAFETKTVEGEVHSASALQQYKAEKTRLEQQISDLKTQISSLTTTISSLSSKIKACNATQASLKSSMNSYAYEMNHYKKFMY